MDIAQAYRKEYTTARLNYHLQKQDYERSLVSNLDVFLYSLQKYAPEARIVVLVDRRERQFVEKLSALFPLHAVLQHPVREQDIEPLFG